jgi:hypothetical protein
MKIKSYWKNKEIKFIDTVNVMITSKGFLSSKKRSIPNSGQLREARLQDRDTIILHSALFHI